MKKVFSILINVIFMVVCAVSSFAGPSRAIVQEMGSVIGAGEINVDLDWVSQKVSVASASDTTIGNGDRTTSL